MNNLFGQTNFNNPSKFPITSTFGTNNSFGGSNMQNAFNQSANAPTFSSMPPMSTFSTMNNPNTNFSTMNNPNTNFSTMNNPNTNFGTMNNANTNFGNMNNPNTNFSNMNNPNTNFSTMTNRNFNSGGTTPNAFNQNSNFGNFNNPTSSIGGMNNPNNNFLSNQGVNSSNVFSSSFGNVNNPPSTNNNFGNNFSSWNAPTTNQQNPLQSWNNSQPNTFSNWPNSSTSNAGQPLSNWNTPSNTTSNWNTPSNATTNWNAASNATTNWNAASNATTNWNPTSNTTTNWNAASNPTSNWNNPSNLSNWNKPANTSFGMTNNFGSQPPQNTSTGFWGNTQSTNNFFQPTNPGFAPVQTNINGSSLDFRLTSVEEFAVVNNKKQQVVTNFQTILAMPEYSGKSLEEIRYEDYVANRKSNSAFAGGTMTSSAFGVNNAFNTSNFGLQTGNTSVNPNLGVGLGFSTANTGGLAPMNSSSFGGGLNNPVLGQGVSSNSNFLGTAPTNNFFGQGGQPNSNFGQPLNAAGGTNNSFGQPFNVAGGTNNSFGQPLNVAGGTNNSFGQNVGTPGCFGQNMGIPGGLGQTSQLFPLASNTMGQPLMANPGMNTNNAFGQPLGTNNLGQAFGGTNTLTGFPAVNNSLALSQPINNSQIFAPNNLGQPLSNNSQLFPPTSLGQPLLNNNTGLLNNNFGLPMANVGTFPAVSLSQSFPTAGLGANSVPAFPNNSQIFPSSNNFGQGIAGSQPTFPALNNPGFPANNFGLSSNTAFPSIPTQAFPSANLGQLPNTNLTTIFPPTNNLSLQQPNNPSISRQLDMRQYPAEMRERLEQIESFVGKNGNSLPRELLTYLSYSPYPSRRRKEVESPPKSVKGRAILPYKTDIGHYMARNPGNVTRGVCSRRGNLSSHSFHQTSISLTYKSTITDYSLNRSNLSLRAEASRRATTKLTMLKKSLLDKIPTDFSNFTATQPKSPEPPREITREDSPTVQEAVGVPKSAFSESFLVDTLRTSNSPDVTPPSIVCSNSNYRVVPSLDEINSAVEGGNWRVNDLVISLPDVGSIRFLEPVELAPMDISETVLITEHIIELYPDERGRPAMGKGLNVHAQVKIYNCWPYRKTTGEVIKSPEMIERCGWVDNLKTQTREMDAEFVSYAPEGGEWIFRINGPRTSEIKN